VIARRSVAASTGETITRGELLTMLDGGVGVSALQMWWRGLTGRSLVLRVRPSGERYRVGALRDGRVELRWPAPGPEEKTMLLAPTEVCRRFVMERDRSEIAPPGEEGAGR
jgi:hypothetical protein